VGEPEYTPGSVTWKPRGRSADAIGQSGAEHGQNGLGSPSLMPRIGEHPEQCSTWNIPRAPRAPSCQELPIHALGPLSCHHPPRTPQSAPNPSLPGSPDPETQTLMRCPPLAAPHALHRTLGDSRPVPSGPPLPLAAVPRGIPAPPRGHRASAVPAPAVEDDRPTPKANQHDIVSRMRLLCQYSPITLLNKVLRPSQRDCDPYIYVRVSNTLSTPYSEPASSAGWSGGAPRRT
jgi:hypothetical protein